METITPKVLVKLSEVKQPSKLYKSPYLAGLTSNNSVLSSSEKFIPIHSLFEFLTDMPLNLGAGEVNLALQVHITVFHQTLLQKIQRFYYCNFKHWSLFNKYE